MIRYLIDTPFDTSRMASDEPDIFGVEEQIMPNYEVEWLEPCDLDELDHDFLRLWRSEVKIKLDWVYGNLRPRTCLVCGANFSRFDMHEGIVTRNDVRGWKRPLRLLIMSEINCIPLHHSCHLDHPPSRQDVWDMQCKFYGSKIVHRWYTQLPWKKGVPRRF